MAGTSVPRRQVPQYRTGAALKFERGSDVGVHADDHNVGLFLRDVSSLRVAYRLRCKAPVSQSKGGGHATHVRICPQCRPP